MGKEGLEVLINSVKDLLEDEEELNDVIEAGFEEFDKNENNVLELEEFIEIVKDMYKKCKGEQNIGNEEIFQLFKETDTNHDDKVDKAEFKPLFIKITTKYLKCLELQLATIN